MIVTEGTPEQIFAAFHESSAYHDPILCIFLSSRRNDAVLLKDLIDGVLEVDSQIQENVAFLICGNGVFDPVFAKEHSRLIVVPGFTASGGKKAQERVENRKKLLRDSWWKPNDEAIQKFVRKHQAFSDEMCRYLGINPATMPQLVVSVRGVAKPWAFTLTPGLPFEVFVALLGGIARLASKIDIEAEKAKLDIRGMREVVYAYRNSEERLSSLRRKAREQLDRAIRYGELPTNVSEAIYRRAEHGELDIRQLAAQHPAVDLMAILAKSQNLQKAVRIAEEIAQQVKQQEAAFASRPSLVENTVAYFRYREGAAEEFRVSVEELIDKIGRPALTARMLNGVEMIDRTDKTIQTFARVAVLAKKVAPFLFA